MPLTPDQAATIARRHGLSLMDAAGLLTLADTEDDADAIAARFATATEPDAEQQMRDYAAALFGRKDRPDPTPPTPTPGHVVREGVNPPLPDKDGAVRRFVSDLFDHPTPHDR